MHYQEEEGEEHNQFSVMELGDELVEMPLYEIDQHIHQPKHFLQKILVLSETKELYINIKS